MLRAILSNKNMSLYQLEKSSNISHSTLSDIYNEKINIDNCSIAVIKKISTALNLTVDDVYEMLSYADLSALTFSVDFDLFKSNVCQELKRLGDVEFLKKHLSSDDVRKLFDNKEYEKSLYLLCMIDYLLMKRNLPVPSNYHDIREYKLKKVYVPQSIYLLCKMKEITITDVYKKSIPLFMYHNIVESEIENVA